MISILVINGSYRDDGITEQVLQVMIEAAEAAGARVDTIHLRDYPIEFCLNCRECTQQPGEQPGHCVQDDGMHALVDKIEHSDAFILASPTNFGSVTAVFKRFLERLVVYAYWPWGMPAPKMRKTVVTKKALLVSSCAAPALLGRLFFQTRKQLEQAARTIGAKPVGSLMTGLIAQRPDHQLSEKERQKAYKLVRKLF